LFLCLSSFASRKNGSADSLKSVLDKIPDYKKNPDTGIINKLNKLSEEYFSTNPDSAYFYGKQSIELSKKINYPTGLAGGLLQTGRVNYFEGRSAEAKRDLARAVVIYKKLKDYQGLSTCYIAYARMYNLLAQYQVALTFLDSAKKVNKKIHDEKGLTDTYKNYGIVYYSQGNIPSALDFYYEALYLAVKNHYQVLSSEIYNDIGVVLQTMEVYPNALLYFNKALGIVQKSSDIQIIGTINENIGEILLAEDKYDAAIIHLKKSLAIAKHQDDKDGLGSVYTDLGLCYAHKNQYGLAISYLDTSVTIASDYKFVYNQSIALIGLATVYNMQKDYANAYKYAMQGQAYAVKLGNLKVRADAAQELNKTLAGLGKYDQAYVMLNQYLQLKNELKDNESIEKLTSYNFALDFSSKERLLTQQQQEKDLLYAQKLRGQRLINIIFFVIIIGMVGISVVYYRQKRKQQKINVLLEEKNREIQLQKASIDEQANKLNDLNVLKDRLISILAHDLRSPLNTLRGLFDLLQDDTITHQEMIEMIPGVLKKLEYTSDFLDTLLSWISSQMENFDNSLKSFYVKDIVSYEVENYHEQAAQKGINLIYDVPADLLAAADPNSIRIVVRNLITNAIKFSGDNDTISVYADQSDDKNITIKVRDTGTGIEPLKLKKLFKSRVDSGTGTKNESGTGLGLLFCKDLVEKCNGRIWVTSKQGTGTEFAFTVPSNDVLQVA
jgi:two-component system sensor histidine kinase/response regulator